jgi:hypothetical protein
MEPFPLTFISHIAFSGFVVIRNVQHHFHKILRKESTAVGFSVSLFITESRGISVSIETRLLAGRPGFNSRQGQ